MTVCAAALSHFPGECTELPVTISTSRPCTSSPTSHLQWDNVLSTKVTALVLENSDRVNSTYFAQHLRRQKYNEAVHVNI